MKCTGEEYVYFLIKCTSDYVALDLSPIEYALVEDVARDETERVIIQTLVNKRLLDLGFTYSSERKSWTRKGWKSEEI